jgi:NADH-quinone oxidoreductase subunit G
MKDVAHVLLPVGTYVESSGTYVNLEGTWQSFGGAARPLGDARPAWKVLRVLGNLLGLQGFDYDSSEQVRDELRGLAGQAGPAAYAGRHRAEGGAGGTVDVPMYQVDAIVRRAPSLQRTREGRASASVYQG